VRIDWRAAQGAGHWVRLPTYPWRDTRFWHETPASRDSRTAPPEHPILARRIEAASPTWEVDLEAPRLGFLADHEIQGVVVFPGAGYIEMAAHAGRSLYGSLDAMEFEDVRFTKALYLSPDQLQTLRITIEPATHDFVIASRPYGVERAGWHVHCTGRLRLSQAAGEPAADLAALQAQCPHEVARSACYEHFRTLGLEYGSSFQGIARLWQGDGQALARVEVPAELHATLADFNAHPAVLDVCFQTLAAALPMQQGASMVYMPTGVSAGRCHRPLATRMWIHAQITERDASGMAGNIMLYDDDGEPVIRIHQCRARALGDQGQAAATPQKLYQPDWIEQERGAPRNEPQPGVWLVHGGSAELSAATLAALRQAGNTALAVHDDKGFRVSAQGLHVNGVDESSWLQLLVHAQQAGEVRGVVRLDAQDDPVPAAGPVAECIDRAMSRSCLVTLALAKALTKVEAAARPRLWIVTRGTQCAGGQPVANPLDAGVWGLGRVLGHGEHIDIWGGMIDLCLRPTAGEGALIAAECVQGDGEDQIAWRGAQRYVMRLHECPAEVALPTAPQLRANATYLVTGGLGALGLVVSKWMVEHGARHLMLLGREGLPPRDRWRDATLPQAVRSRIAAVRDIEASGASVRIEALDIADRAALESLVTAHEQAGYPPIRGVIHAAGVAKPQLSAQMSAEEFKSVWPAKVLGAWNLHGVFSGPGRRLDFFTLFSSVASLVISMGQGNYAAANACLDALAHWRRAAGLPAVSINWGPWGDVGMATQLDLLKLFHNRGFFPMTAVQGCQALGQLMSGRAGQAVVLGAHWKTVGDTSPLGIPAPMLEHLIRDEAASAQATPGKAASGVSFLTGYRACETPEGRRELLTDHLRALACRVLRVEESALGTDDTLHSHGMDSMMAIELKNRIEQSTKVRVAIVDLLKGASVHALADMVAPEIDAIHGNVTGALAEIVDAMQELRAEEIDALLAQEEAAQEAAAAEEMK
jgi:NAD(P)-dependent dehydrogenase (short-subunit alcohol dehydrogenase family)/acyl carrier protein